jgi:hypothetical protein
MTAAPIATRPFASAQAPLDVLVSASDHLYQLLDKATDMETDEAAADEAVLAALDVAYRVRELLRTIRETQR